MKQIICFVYRIDMSFIERILASANREEADIDEIGLLNALLNAIDNLNLQQLEAVIHSELTAKQARRFVLAAVFDLMVAAKYYAHVEETEWFFCLNASNESKNTLFYPFTNTCPFCVLKGEFHFHRSHKPQSGLIGAATRKLLILMMRELLRRKGHQVDVYSASEPADTIFVDRSVSPILVLFAEVKSAPLLTPALMITTPRHNTRLEGERILHGSANISLLQQTLFISIPQWQQNAQVWVSEYFPIGQKRDITDLKWAFKGIQRLLETHPQFLYTYFNYWIYSFEAYRTKNRQTSVFWMTNGCGQPPLARNILHWPQRRGAGGYERISDGKTSVGMDRTDDIKKSVYQAIKLGIKGKYEANYHYKVAVLSNIHAVRHFNEYFADIENVMWFRSEAPTVHHTGELPSDTTVFNLFDGLIAFTEVRSRDAWLSSLFDF